MIGRQVRVSDPAESQEPGGPAWPPRSEGHWSLCWAHLSHSPRLCFTLSLGQLSHSTASPLPLPQTLVPLCFIRDLGVPLGKVLYLQLWNHPMIWGIPLLTRCGLSPWSRPAFRSHLLSLHPPPSCPAPARPGDEQCWRGLSPFPRKAEDLHQTTRTGCHQTTRTGFHHSHPLTTESLGNHAVFKKKEVIPEAALIT